MNKKELKYYFFSECLFNDLMSALCEVDKDFGEKHYKEMYDIFLPIIDKKLQEKIFEETKEILRRLEGWVVLREVDLTEIPKWNIPINEAAERYCQGYNDVIKEQKELFNDFKKYFLQEWTNQDSK